MCIVRQNVYYLHQATMKQGILIHIQNSSAILSNLSPHLTLVLNPILLQWNIK